MAKRGSNIYKRKDGRFEDVCLWDIMIAEN